MPKMIVDKAPVSVLKIGGEDFISLTDMASGKDGQNRSADIIKNWIRTRYTLEFLGTWEMLNNPDFKVGELGPEGSDPARWHTVYTFVASSLLY